MVDQVDQITQGIAVSQQGIVDITHQQTINCKQTTFGKTRLADVGRSTQQTSSGLQIIADMGLPGVITVGPLDSVGSPGPPAFRVTDCAQ